MIVIDASLMANALLNDGELGDQARAAIDKDSEWLAPSHLIVEVLSVLRKAVRRGEVSEERAQETVSNLTALFFEQIETAMVTERIWELRNNLTVYDAAYVASAERLACPLVTSDARMAKAPGVRCEVVVVGG